MQVWVGNAYQMRWSVLERLHVFSTWRQLGRLRATLFPSYDAQSRVVSTFRGKLSSYFDLSSLKSVPKEGGLFVHLKVFFKNFFLLKNMCAHRFLFFYFNFNSILIEKIILNQFNIFDSKKIIKYSMEFIPKKL